MPPKALVARFATIVLRGITYGISTLARLVQFFGRVLFAAPLSAAFRVLVGSLLVVLVLLEVVIPLVIWVLVWVLNVTVVLVVVVGVIMLVIRIVGGNQGSSEIGLQDWWRD